MRGSHNTLKKILAEALREFPLEDYVKAGIRSLGSPRRCTIAALGKSSVRMARAALEVVEPDGGIAVTPHGTGARIQGLEVVEAGHPVPDENSIRAGMALLEWARSSNCLLALVSGGGSSLAELPYDPITLEDLVEANRLLLESGAPIHEINAVRKHISRIKGGRLAKEAKGRVIGVYVSDVPGDRLESIASGPTVPDSTTYKDALEAIRRYRLEGRMPESIMKVLTEGAMGLRPETPKPGDPSLQGRVSNTLAAANKDILSLVAGKVASHGYNAVMLTSMLQGESREAGRVLASIAMDAISNGIPGKPPLALVAGGETTVTVRGGGRGGRNMELVYSIALEAWRMGYEGILAAAVDTDGIDGNTPAAGAVAGPGDIEGVVGMGLEPWRPLEENDTYSVFERLGRLIVTGPTGLNLNSIVVVLVDGG
ncbi:MAG: DUF4147 domain-containing protein [Desulfurococcales archaeon]|nr:DUF4147 domain-containing protein [Desulfurococcales archaeon]